MNDNFELITIVLIAHKSKKIVLDFINNLSKNIKILVIDNSNDQDLENEIKKKENYTKFNYTHSYISKVIDSIRGSVLR